MSSRLRNLIAVFCISIAMWFGIVHAGVGLYGLTVDHAIEPLVTGSVK